MYFPRSNVQVTLQILTALIEKLPRDLPLYGHSVLTILETVIRSNVVTMVEESVPTFETFCSHQDASALAADHEYASQYRDIVRSYAAFASPSAGTVKSSLSPPEAIRWRSVGLQAIKSVVSSEALGADGGKQLNIVVPVILQNLYLGGNEVLTSLQEKAQSTEQHEREQARRRRMSIATVQTVDTVDGHPSSAAGTTADADKAAEVEARVLSLRCLERIFVTGSNRSQVRLATTLILRFITSKNPPRDPKKSDSNWATSLMEATATWTPVQYRFAILVTAVETLISSPAVEEKLEEQLTLASMIDSLLSSSINMIGLSVMDVLIGLVQHILRLLKPGGQEVTPHHQQSTEYQEGQEPAEVPLSETPVEKVHSLEREISTPSPARQELVTLLERCIGDLATHIYYGDQVSDMISAIMSRLKPSAAAHISAAASENLSATEKSTANTATLQEDHQTHNPFFSFATARIVALKAIKNILVVANTEQSVKNTGAESRNRVGIRVWEGTPWLLRDKNREVQRAYTDALLSWLQLETSKEDLKVASGAKKLTRKSSRRGASGPVENSAKRAISATSQREKLHAPTRSTFLQLLHLAIYENAIESATNEADIMLLHLLLTRLMDKIGVNAVRHSLPVVMRLQEDMGCDTFTSPVARRNVGSLIHGYLWSLSQRFNFQSSKIGNNLENEIAKRKKLGCWLDNIRYPALSLDGIRSIEAQHDPEIQFDKRAIAPFTAINSLVDQIELAYNAAAASSPISSAPSSPGRVSSLPIFGQGQHSATSPKPQVDEQQLPMNVKEEMLSTWSKDICLAAVERENAKASSLTASKTGTSGPRNYLFVNGNGNENGSPAGDSPTALYRRNQLNDRPPSTSYGLVGGINANQKVQRGDDSHTPLTSSSRESTVRVNELRRVLSATNENNVRHSSPLRGRMDFARRGSRSSGTSSRESMISGAFSASDIDPSTADPVSSRPQSLRDGNGKVTHGQRDSSATLKASTAKVNNGDPEGSNTTVTKVKPNGIPPVPPLPAALSIPGGFPDSAAGSPVPSPTFSPAKSDFRPSTAPSQQRARPTAKPKQDTASAPRQSRSLNRPKSRRERNASLGKQTASVSPLGRDNGDNAGDNRSLYREVLAESSRGASREHDVDKLLDGIFTPGINGGVDDAASGLQAPGNVKYNALGDVPGSGKRRQSAGGIGRPPY